MTDFDAINRSDVRFLLRAGVSLARRRCRERASMKEVSIVGLDLAKRVFEVHAAGSDGAVVLRRKLSRGQILAFFTELPKCTRSA